MRPSPTYCRLRRTFRSACRPVARANRPRHEVRPHGDVGRVGAGEIRVHTQHRQMPDESSENENSKPSAASMLRPPEVSRRRKGRGSPRARPGCPQCSCRRRNRSALSPSRSTSTRTVCSAPLRVFLTRTRNPPLTAPKRSPEVTVFWGLFNARVRSARPRAREPVADVHPCWFDAAPRRRSTWKISLRCRRVKGVDRRIHGFGAFCQQGADAAGLGLNPAPAVAHARSRRRPRRSRCGSPVAGHWASSRSRGVEPRRRCLRSRCRRSRSS